MRDIHAVFAPTGIALNKHIQETMTELMSSNQERDNAVKELKTLKDASGQDWIKVEDRLPQKDDTLFGIEYRVFSETSDEVTLERHARYKNGKWYEDGSDEPLEEITHWQVIIVPERLNK
jgi:hypothetical protein